MIQSSSSKTNTTFNLSKYSRGRANLNDSSQSQNQQSQSSQPLLSSETEPSPIKWTHFTQPTLTCRVEQVFGSTRTAQKVAESLWVSIQWRIPSSNDNDAISQNQSQNAGSRIDSNDNSECMTLERIDLLAFNPTNFPASFQTNPSDPNLIKAVIHGKIVGFKYAHLDKNSNKRDSRRFQLKFGEEASAQSFIELIQNVCSVTVKPSTSSPQKGKLENTNSIAHTVNFSESQLSLKNSPSNVNLNEDETSTIEEPSPDSRPELSDSSVGSKYSRNLGAFGASSSTNSDHAAASTSSASQPNLGKSSPSSPRNIFTASNPPEKSSSNESKLKSISASNIVPRLQTSSIPPPRAALVHQTSPSVGNHQIDSRYGFPSTLKTHTPPSSQRNFIEELRASQSLKGSPDKVRTGLQPTRSLINSAREKTPILLSPRIEDHDHSDPIRPLKHPSKSGFQSPLKKKPRVETSPLENLNPNLSNPNLSSRQSQSQSQHQQEMRKPQEMIPTIIRDPTLSLPSLSSFFQKSQVTSESTDLGNKNFQPEIDSLFPTPPPSSQFQSRPPALSSSSSSQGPMSSISPLESQSRPVSFPKDPLERGGGLDKFKAKDKMVEEKEYLRNDYHQGQRMSSFFNTSPSGNEDPLSSFKTTCQSKSPFSGAVPQSSIPSSASNWHPNPTLAFQDQHQDQSLNSNPNLGRIDHNQAITSALNLDDSQMDEIVFNLLDSPDFVALCDRVETSIRRRMEGS